MRDKVENSEIMLVLNLDFFLEIFRCRAAIENVCDFILVIFGKDTNQPIYEIDGANYHNFSHRLTLFRFSDFFFQKGGLQMIQFSIFYSSSYGILKRGFTIRKYIMLVYESE